MITNFRLLGSPINPVNRKDISLSINNEQNSIVNQPTAQVSINNLIFDREDVAKLMATMNTSPGITEGKLFQIDITEQGVTNTIDMYLDLMDGLKISNDGVEVSAKMYASLDHLDDIVDGFTMESMYNEKGIATFQVDGISYTSYQDFFDRRFIYVPYVLSSIPDYRDSFMALLTITYCINELTKIIKTISQWATPLAGIGAVVGVAQLVFEIIYAITLVAAIISLIVHLFNCLVQPIKYHAAMLLTDMLKIVAVKCGKSFDSSIWNTFPLNQIAYLPEKYNPTQDIPSAFTIFGIQIGAFQKTGYTSPAYAPSSAHDSSTSGFQKGYLNGTGGDVLRIAKKYCNGKIILANNNKNLLLERKDFFPASSGYQLPDIRQDWNGYNTDELVSNIILKFSDDFSDKNCTNFIDKNGNRFYVGTILQATHAQIITNDSSLILLKGISEIQIGAARGAAKDKLNLIEEIIGVLSVAFNNIVGPVCISAVNLLITGLDVIIQLLNALIDIMNALFKIINAIIKIIHDICKILGIKGIGTWNGIPLAKHIATIPLMNNQSLLPFDLTGRLSTLLLESDIVSVPKLLLIDILRSEFKTKRIAYLHSQNADIVNAKYLWENYYFINSFVGSNNNRYTKISPALNKSGDGNKFLLSCTDFFSIIDNPKIKDSFGEDIIMDKITWRVGDESGITDIDFRKAGWLAAPHSIIGSQRAKEIDINLTVKTSLPNGQ